MAAPPPHTHAWMHRHTEALTHPHACTYARMHAPTHVHTHAASSRQKLTLKAATKPRDTTILRIVGVINGLMLISLLTLPRRLMHARRHACTYA
eukprot:355670-Chlamydomonas_euryale.AAC.2